MVKKIKVLQDGKVTMKAYKISDLKGYADYSTVVFAETSGKAKAIAITTDAFNDYEFTEISARRVPKLDKYYRGLDEMDWFDDADRIAMVRDAGYSCDPEYWEEEYCTRCPAKQWCEMWQNDTRTKTETQKTAKNTTMP